MSKENVHKKHHNHKLTLHFKVILKRYKTKLCLECILVCRHMPSAVKQQTRWYGYAKSHIKRIKRYFCFMGGGGVEGVFKEKIRFR